MRRVAIALPIFLWLALGIGVFATADTWAPVRHGASGGDIGVQEIETVTNGTASPKLLTAADSGKTFVNDGATETTFITLPEASQGLWFRFIETDASDLMRITAQAGDTIEINASITSTGGHIQASVSGSDSSVTLVAVDGVQWVSLALRNGWDAYDGVLNAATGLHAGYFFSTPIATANETDTPIKCAGNTTQIEARGFTHTDNKVVYDGIATKDFLVTATVSFTAAAATTGKLHLYKSGVLITGSTVRRVIANNAEGAWAIAVTTDLSTDQFVELYCETNDGDDITITAGAISVTGVSSN